MAKLIFTGEKFAGRVYEFAVEKTTVGRGDHNTLTIHDSSISHSHCEILVYGTEVIVRDLGSSNGTYVDGVRLHDQQRPLVAGQSVRFGSVEARLAMEPISTSNTDTDVTAVHSYARYLRDHNEPKASPPVAAKIETEPTPSAADQTLSLPDLPGTAEHNAPPPSTTSAVTEKLPRKTGLAFIVVVVGLGLVIVLWLILTRNR